MHYGHLGARRGGGRVSVMHEIGVLEDVRDPGVLDQPSPPGFASARQFSIPLLLDALAAADSTPASNLPSASE